MAKLGKMIIHCDWKGFLKDTISTKFYNAYHNTDYNPITQDYGRFVLGYFDLFDSEEKHPNTVLQEALYENSVHRAEET